MMTAFLKDSIMEKLVSTAVTAAVSAGKEILAVYESETQVWLKADSSPLTEADKRAHLAIVHTLETEGLPVLSEEGRETPFVERSSWHRFWMVDPLDGTKEFIKRNGEFTVNIALIEDGVPVLGIVYAPVTGILYAGIRDKGSFKLSIPGLNKDHINNGDTWAIAALRTASPLPLPCTDRPYTIVASRSHSSAETTAFIESRRMQHPDLELISSGSSLKICLVAEGAADVYPRFAPTMEWDTAAGHAVAIYAGKGVMKADEEIPLRYNKEDLTNPWFIVQ